MARFAITLVLLTSFFLCGAQNNNDDHKVAPELVGKWCYISRSASTLENLTNSCITLNADGTYEMQLDRSVMIEGSVMPQGQTSDAGTWWVSGTILFYHSNSEGQGSVPFQKANHPRIENTPVLIVQGAIFCSATPRDPW